MNISNATASFSSQASASTTRSQGQRPPRGEAQLSSALNSIGVDDSTAANVLAQVDDAISTLKSASSSGTTGREAIKSVIDDVLQANGIDSAKVEEAIQTNSLGRASGTHGISRTGGPSGAGRPAGPPPPRRQREDESESSAVQSALLFAGAEESSTDELISQIIKTIQELSTDAGNSISQDELRSALSSLFEENGVDIDAFEQALNAEIGSAGSFFDRLA
jgi:Clp amino terminal domain, pathogenicity island component